MENRFTKVLPRPLACYYMQAVHRAIEIHPKKAAKALFPGFPDRHRKATCGLAVLAYNKAKSIDSQAKNQTNFKNAYDTACQSVWDSLPDYAKERWKELPETTMHRLHQLAYKNYSALPGSDYEDDFTNLEPEEEINFPPGSPMPIGEA